MDRKGEISPRFFWWLVLLVDMWKYSNRILKVPFCPVPPLLLRVKCMCSKAQNYISYRSLPRFLTSKQRRTAITTFAIITTCYQSKIVSCLKQYFNFPPEFKSNRVNYPHLTLLIQSSVNIQGNLKNEGGLLCVMEKGIHKSFTKCLHHRTIKLQTPDLEVQGH